MNVIENAVGYYENSLQEQAQKIDYNSQFLLRQVGIEQGMSILVINPVSLDIMHWLLSVVGGNGEITLLNPNQNLQNEINYYYNNLQIISNEEIYRMNLKFDVIYYRAEYDMANVEMIHIFNHLYCALKTTGILAIEYLAIYNSYIYTHAGINNERWIRTLSDLYTAGFNIISNKLINKLIMANEGDGSNCIEEIKKIFYSYGNREEDWQFLLEKEYIDNNQQVSGLIVNNQLACLKATSDYIRYKYTIRNHKECVPIKIPNNKSSSRYTSIYL